MLGSKMSAIVPEYGTSEYARWRSHVTPAVLRWLVDSRDVGQMMAIRATLAVDAVHSNLGNASEDKILQLLAHGIQRGELAVVNQPRHGEHPSQWLTHADRIPLHNHPLRPVTRPAAGSFMLATPDAAEAAKAALAPRKTTRSVTIYLASEHDHNVKSHETVKNGTRYRLMAEGKVVREGEVRNGRIDEHDLPIGSEYALTFVTPH